VRQARPWCLRCCPGVTATTLGRPPHRPRRPGSPTTVGTSAPWSSSPCSELRITRVFSCVARGFKVCPSFMFAGCCCRRSSAVDGNSGASRGHAPEVRRPGSRWSGAVERPSAFHQAGRIPCWRESCERLCAAAGRCCSPMVAAVAVSPRVSGLGRVDPRRSPPRAWIPRRVCRSKRARTGAPASQIAITD
jgi:hypothetical protein